MRKYYYENVLANENITTKTNIAWVADITISISSSNIYS
jgi:hypothetical protein